MSLIYVKCSAVAAQLVFRQAEQPVCMVSMEACAGAVYWRGIFWRDSGAD